MKTTQKSTASPNRIGQQLKVARSGSGSINSSTSLSKTPKKRSPKVLERGPRSPMTEKHTPSKLPDLESRLAQLEDELKKAKEHLSSSETLKLRAQQEVEETKKQLSAMSARLEESQQELFEISNSEDSRVKELRKISQERDRVWQSELEVIQKQHSMDSIALASALNEIQRLKRQLEMATESEKTQNMRAESAHTELENLRAELSEALSLVEDVKKQVDECKGSEAQALEVAREAQVQLEEAMKSKENLCFEGVKVKEAYNSLVSELEESRGEVTSLENFIKKLEEDLEIRSRNLLDDNIELKGEIESLKLEIRQLKTALEASELRYQEEHIQSTLQIRNAYDTLEWEKSDSSSRVVEFEAELKQAKDTIEELKQEIIKKETMLKNLSENNKELSIKIEEIEINSKKPELEKEIEKLKEDIQNLKVGLMGKETQVQSTIEENEKLKEEINKREKERSKANEETNERELRVARVSEQLEAAKTTNAELEGELRRLKVQSDQWRKAAEQAASMLSNGGNGKFVDRTVSLDGSYNTLVSNMESPLYDELDDDFAKKKNGNMLKKIGVLWKKGSQK